jgi:dTDP-4-dehydrorhamnose reductase
MNIESVLVTGSSGLLGKKVFTKSLQRGHETYGWRHRSNVPGACPVDITDRRQVDEFFDDHALTCCIHCAAISDVYACERDPVTAVRVNVEGTRYVTEACARIGIYMIFLSTDYVFDGVEQSYTEDDVPSPLQVYGRTKRDAERIVLEHPYALVLRTALLFGYNDPTDKPTWPRIVAEKLRADEPVDADNTELRQPTLIDDLAEVILAACDHKITGILHATAQQGATKYEWGCEVARYLGADTDLIRIAEPRPGGPPRPKRSWLATPRLRELDLPKPRPVAETTAVYLREAGFLASSGGRP